MLLSASLLFTCIFHLSRTGIPAMFVFYILMCMVLRFKEHGWAKAVYRNTSSQHSCCMLCVFHYKYCILHTCISLKIKNMGSYTHKNLVSFLPIVGTGGGMLDIIPFLFFSKMNSIVFFKKQGKTCYLNPKWLQISS